MIEEDNMHDDGDVYMGEYKPPFAIKLMKCDGYIKMGSYNVITAGKFPHSTITE